MPGGDRTGPVGRGPLTGRGLGPCGGGKAYGYAAGRRAGYGLGLGLGRRGRWGGYVQPAVADSRSDKELLTEEREILSRRLELVDKELETLSETNKE